MNNRAAVLGFIVAFGFLAMPAQAQSTNSVAARLAALEARVGKLESGQVDAADLVGTYRAISFGIDLVAPPANVGVETNAGTLTLKGDGTFSITNASSNCELQQGSLWSVACNQQSGSADFTWSVNDGKVVLDFGDDTGEAFIGSGGRVLIDAGTTSHPIQAGAAFEAFSNLIIAVRLPNP